MQIFSLSAMSFVAIPRWSHQKTDTDLSSVCFLLLRKGKRTRSYLKSSFAKNSQASVRARRALRHTRTMSFLRTKFLSQSPGGVTCFQVLFLLHYSDGSERGAYISLITQPLSRDAFVLVRALRHTRTMSFLRTKFLSQSPGGDTLCFKSCLFALILCLCTSQYQ